MDIVAYYEPVLKDSGGRIVNNIHNKKKIAEIVVLLLTLKEKKD